MNGNRSLKPQQPNNNSIVHTHHNMKAAAEKYGKWIALVIVAAATLLGTTAGA